MHVHVPKAGYEIAAPTIEHLRSSGNASVIRGRYILNAAPRNEHGLVGGNGAADNIDHIHVFDRQRRTLPYARARESPSN